MKTITALLAAGLVFTAAAQNSSTDQTKKSAPKKVVPVPPSPTIPKDAVALPDGSYRYVDKDGKKWIYRNTPFGVSKAEEHPPAPVATIADDPTRSEDLGESVRFTKATPFGNKVWTTKKTELSSFEKSIFDRDQKKTATGAQASEDAKQDRGR